MQFTRSIKDSPQAAEFRIAVSGAGEVRYAFLQRSSGDGALDRQARQFLVNCRFLGANGNSADLIWTTAAIVWGSDVAAPKEP